MPAMRYSIMLTLASLLIRAAYIARSAGSTEPACTFQKQTQADSKLHLYLGGGGGSSSWPA